MGYVENTLKQGLGYDQIVPIEIYSYEDFVKMMRVKQDTKPVSTGSKDLDEIIGGFERGRLYVLSAPTKQGKTTLAQGIMFDMAKSGISSLFFSYEMGNSEVTKKYADMDGLTSWHGTPTNLPLYSPKELHRGGGELQFQWLYEAIVKSIAENNTQLVVIDHLHFLLPLKDYQNTSFLIGGIVREIKRMAVNLNIPIMLITHVQKIKDDKVPDWTDIRDSSFITQEADVVLMMYRLKNKEAAKKMTDDSDAEVYTRKAILSVELDRVRGKSQKIKLWHNGKKFETYTNQDGKNNR